MKKIVLTSGFLPGRELPYTGQYIYKVKAFREGAHGLGPDFPQPEFLDYDLEGSGGIEGKLETVKPVRLRKLREIAVLRFAEELYAALVKAVEKSRKRQPRAVHVAAFYGARSEIVRRVNYLQIEFFDDF